jgi:site-specific DNA recombinase
VVPLARPRLDFRIRWLGSGLYLCGVCGQPELRVSHSGGGKRQPAYRCRARDTTRRHSGHVARAATQLDDYVQRLIVARLQRPDAAKDFTAPSGPGIDTTALHTEAAAIGQRLTDFSEAFADGAITVSQLRTGTDKLRARLADIEDNLAAAATVNPLIGLAGHPHVADLWYGSHPTVPPDWISVAAAPCYPSSSASPCCPPAGADAQTKATSTPPESASNGRPANPIDFCAT